MKIAKYVNHFGVDKMLKTALGDSLELFKIDDECSSDHLFTTGVEHTPSEVRDEDWDIFIIDDHYTMIRFAKSGCRAKRYVWYCHGTFTEWREPQQFFNRCFNDISVIYTDDFKRALTETWREFTVRDTLTLPIALANDDFTEPVAKAGRIGLIGNSYAEVCSNYPRNQTFVVPAYQWLLEEHREKIDVYGYNDQALSAVVFGTLRRGSAKINTLGTLSASVHLSATASIGFVLAECFAAGIPVVATPKFQLPREGWRCVYSVEQLQREVNKLVADPEYAHQLGTEGQEMYKRHFGFRHYKRTLIEWLEKQI